MSDGNRQAPSDQDRLAQRAARRDSQLRVPVQEDRPIYSVAPPLADRGRPAQKAQQGAGSVHARGHQALLRGRDGERLAREDAHLCGAVNRGVLSAQQYDTLRTRVIFFGERPSQAENISQ